MVPGVVCEGVLEGKSLVKEGKRRAENKAPSL